MGSSGLECAVDCREEIVKHPYRIFTAIHEAVLHNRISENSPVFGKENYPSFFLDLPFFFRDAPLSVGNGLHPVPISRSRESDVRLEVGNSHGRTSRKYK